MGINFTMTAMCRPEIVARTLTSFQEKLTGIELKKQTIHLNVDPLPDKDRQKQVVELVGQFFDTVHFNLPEAASFPAAVKWCWGQPLTPYFFHLEDDWELRESMNIQAMVLGLMDDPGLSTISLRAYDFDEDDSRICLSPGLFRSTHARVMALRLRLDANPEKQLRRVDAANPIGDAHVGFRGKFVPDVGKRVIFDIGRDWLARSGMKKNNGIYFTTWE